MKPGLRVPYTAISTSDTGSITVRGKDLCKELIGETDFVRYFLYLLTGREASEDQVFFLNATLISIAEHGLVPSNQVARMTYAAAPESLQGAVAAGLMGCGSVVFGSSETCGILLARLVGTAGGGPASVEHTALEALRQLRTDRKTVPGFGHPQHVDGDPRAQRLLALARSRQAAGQHICMLEALERQIPEVYGRTLPINVSGAIPAVMLDVGFPVEALKGIPLLARTAGLIAHLFEEIHHPIGFLLSSHAARAAIYDGPAAGRESEAEA